MFLDRIFLGLLTKGVYLPGDYWLRSSGGLTRLEVEVGCGDGAFLLASARARPYTFFSGLEIREQSVRGLLDRDALPDNLSVFHGDGRWVIAELLAENSVDALHVYFPDPWWKKRHHKRRLFTSDFCAGAERCLKPDGRLYLATDVESRFVDICDALAAQGLIREQWQRDEAGAAGSSYEAKYRRQGRRFYQAAFGKASGV